MGVDANSLAVNLAVTVIVMVMVFLLPFVDRRVSKRLRLNLTGGVSENEKAGAYLRARRALLLVAFGVYAAAVAWLVFFSRAAASEYKVHVALFEDLKGAIAIDFGVLGVLRVLFTEGPSAALSHIRVVNTANITQAYMNVMLFVPMGYLLPYVFYWFRQKPRIRPVMACAVISFLIENCQLIFKRGFYDVDDLICNIIGGFIGQWLFILAAYVVTHPDWRKELKRTRRWKRNARKRTLFPFARQLSLGRATLFATGEEAVWDFYVTALGFRPLKQLVPEDSNDTFFLLGLGRTQVEVRCSNDPENLKTQYLTITARRLTPIMNRLKANGIQTGPFVQDPYTGLRSFVISGPDGVVITFLGK